MKYKQANVELLYLLEVKVLSAENCYTLYYSRINVKTIFYVVITN